MSKKVCECCGKIINPVFVSEEVVISMFSTYFEDEYGDVAYCEECGEDLLTFASDIEQYVYAEDYKECYLDDELSDILMFERYYMSSLEPIEEEPEEPDWDGYNDDKRMGLI